MKKENLRGKLAAATFFLIASFGVPGHTECVEKEFVTDYCYFGLTERLGDDAIAVEPRQYGYEASTIVEIKRRESVQYVVSCDNGQLPIQDFTRVAREEKRLISEERQAWSDAIFDLKENYSRLRVRINNYLCKN